MMFRQLISLLLVGVLSACAGGGTYQMKSPGAKAGSHQDVDQLDASDIRVEKPFLESYKRMIYLRVDDKTPELTPSERYYSLRKPEVANFYIQSLRDTGAFDQVVDKDALQEYVIAHNLGDKVPSVTELVGLNNLSREIGPFLIVVPDIRRIGAYTFRATFKVYDASTGQVVLWIERDAINWIGLDGPLLRPIFNGFARWTRHQPMIDGATAAAQSAGKANPQSPAL